MASVRKSRQKAAPATGAPHDTMLLLDRSVPEIRPGSRHHALELWRLGRQRVEVADLDARRFGIDRLLNLSPERDALLLIGLAGEGVQGLLASGRRPPAR